MKLETKRFPAFVFNFLDRMRVATESNRRKWQDLTDEQSAKLNRILWVYLVVWILVFLVLCIEWTVWPAWVKYPLAGLMLLFAPDGIPYYFIRKSLFSN